MFVFPGKEDAIARIACAAKPGSRSPAVRAFSLNLAKASADALASLHKTRFPFLARLFALSDGLVVFGVRAVLVQGSCLDNVLGVAETMRSGGSVGNIFADNCFPCPVGSGLVLADAVPQEFRTDCP